MKLFVAPTKNSKTPQLFEASVWAGDVDVEALYRGADPADDFGGPQGFAKERDPAIFGFPDSAECITVVGGLVGIQATAGKFFLERSIAAFDRGAGANSEGFALKSLEELLQLRFGRLAQDQAAFRGFAKMNVVEFAKFADAVDMTEEIDDEEFIGRQAPERPRPRWLRRPCREPVRGFRFPEVPARPL